MVSCQLTIIYVHTVSFYEEVKWSEDEVKWEEENKIQTKALICKVEKNELHHKTIWKS